MLIKGEVPECVHRLVTVPGCCVYITPRATTTHNTAVAHTCTSHFAVERFLGLYMYHDAPRGVGSCLLDWGA